MKKQTKKTILWATVYLVVIALAILNFGVVISAANRIGSAFEPFLLGLVIAFLFNKPSMAIENLLNRKIMQHKSRKVTRFFSMIFCYAVFFCAAYFSDQLLASGIDQQHTRHFPEFRSLCVEYANIGG